MNYQVNIFNFQFGKMMAVVEEYNLMINKISILNNILMTFTKRIVI